MILTRFNVFLTGLYVKSCLARTYLLHTYISFTSHSTFFFLFFSLFCLPTTSFIATRQEPRNHAILLITKAHIHIHINIRTYIHTCRCIVDACIYKTLADYGYYSIRTCVLLYRHDNENDHHDDNDSTHNVMHIHILEQHRWIAGVQCTWCAQ